MPTTFLDHGVVGAVRSTNFKNCYVSVRKLLQIMSLTYYVNCPFVYRTQKAFGSLYNFR